MENKEKDNKEIGGNNQKYRRILLIVVAVICAVLYVKAVNAEEIEEPQDTGVVEVSVEDYGAIANDEIADTDAFNAALSAGDRGAQELIVHIPAGEYKLEDKLRVFSNTTILAEEGAVIYTTNHEGGMVYGYHTDEAGSICGWSDCTHGGYSQIQNVTIQGGVWDQRDLDGAGSNGVFVFRHGSDITIQDTTVMNCTNHMMDLSGTKNLKVLNCTFQNQVVYTGSSKGFWLTYAKGDTRRLETIEALHLDFMTEEGEVEAYPYDNTGVKNVLIENCTFEDVHAAIGTHHLNETGRASEVTVKNCTFTDILAFVIWAYDFEKLQVTDNTVTNAKGLITAIGTTGTISKNTIQANGNKDGHAILVWDVYKNETPKVHSDVTISNNTIKDAGGNGIRIEESAKATVSENTIINAATHGICATQKSTLTASNNTVTGSGANGIHVDQNSTGTLSGNTIKSTIGSGVRSDTGAVVIATGNTISDSDDQGMNASRESKLTANNNKISNSAKSGIRGDSNAVISATGNTISKSTDQAISITNKSSIVAKSNVISESGNAGIRVDTESKVQAEGNEIKSSAGNGILATNNSTVVAKNNKITTVKTYHGICMKTGTLTATGNTLSDIAGAGISLESAKGTVTGNTITGTKNHAVVTRYLSGSTVATKATITDNTLKTASTSHRDLRLESGSSGCVVGNNVMGTRGFSAADDAVYTMAAPKGITVANTTAGVKVTWSSVLPNVTYRVYRKTSTTSWVNVGDVKGLSITDTKATSGVTYSYTVKCISDDGKKGLSSFDSKGKSILYVKAPVLSKLEKNNTGVTLAWPKSAGAGKYRIYRKTGSGSFVKLADTTALSYTDKTVVNGTTYTYTVRCMNSAATAFVSSYNGGKTIKPVANPALPTVSKVVGGVKISWKAVSGAGQYRVYRRTASGSWSAIATVKTLTYKDTTAKAGVHYYYTIRCMNSAGTQFVSGYNTTGKYY